MSFDIIVSVKIFLIGRRSSGDVLSPEPGILNLTNGQSW